MCWMVPRARAFSRNEASCCRFSSTCRCETSTPKYISPNDAATRPRTQPPASHGGWELLHNEAGEACEDAPYDPCALFRGKSQAEVARAWPYEAPQWPEAGAPYEVTDKADVPGGWYGKDKARILAAVAMTKTQDSKELQRIFWEY